jgi:CHAT domain-containing protein
MVALHDGNLSASEVAGLKLDADWVILSACNTAAGGAQGDEALSDLARGLHLCRGKRPVAKLERAGLWVERLV